MTPEHWKRIKRLYNEEAYANHACATFSPDGRWLAYCSDSGNGYEVYVTPFPGPGEKTNISQNGGNEAAWARDGRQLFFRDRKRGFMMAVEMSFVPVLKAGQPRPLFKEGGYLHSDLSANYDVTADGRFLMAKNIVIPITQIHVVQNWFEELKQLGSTAR